MIIKTFKLKNGKNVIEILNSVKSVKLVFDRHGLAEFRNVLRTLAGDVSGLYLDGVEPRTVWYPGKTSRMVIGKGVQG